MKKLVLTIAALLLSGAAHAHEVLYNVTQVYFEPDTQWGNGCCNTVFEGSFLFNEHTGTVSGLSGILTESMTGAGTGSAPLFDMTQITLGYQLSSVYDATLGGLLVTTFRNNSTNTLSGGDGWSPESGATGMYYGRPAPNPGNAYARIFVNTTDPTAALTPTQIAALAYADCAPGGMMGPMCMTGLAGGGTMSGYPLSQAITAAPIPEPGTWAMVMAGLGVLVTFGRRRTR